MKTTAVMAPARLPRLAEDTNGLVVCVATGPSLTQADVDSCRGKATVVVVNDAHRMAPWAACLFSSDRYWWNHYKGVPEFGGLKATIEYSPGRAALELRKFAPDMFFLRNTGHNGLETAPDGLRTCGANSGGAALNLALHLGARKVLLLGYDLGATQGRRHFFGDHPSPLSNTHNYPTWRRAFETMVPMFEKLGVSVVNCTRVTSLGCFPQMPIEEAL